MPVPEAHFVNGHPLIGPWPEGMQTAAFAMGCFWGVERKFWQLDGVYSTFVGYAGGYTPNATYEEVCSGLTGHTEAVVVVYDPEVVSYERLLQTFWEEHDPTQGMRQGNDVGSQYRSAIFVTDPSQRPLIESSKEMFQERLELPATARSPRTSSRSTSRRASSTPSRTTSSTSPRIPNGYCGVGGTGVSCPIGLST
jgi:peptide-methionine (S)-S-oxide reductase